MQIVAYITKHMMKHRRHGHSFRNLSALVTRRFFPSRSGLGSDSVTLNPLYIAAVNRPHLAASLAFGVPLFDRTEELVDRNDFHILNPLRPALDRARILRQSGDAPKSLPEIMNSRAEEIWRDSELEGRMFEVLWSGGIDSTAMLVSLLRTAPSDDAIRDRLIVKFAPRAVHENPVFHQGLEKLPCKKKWIVLGEIADAIDDDAISVTGEGGDQLFGSSLLERAFIKDEYGSALFTLDTPWQEAMCAHLDAKLADFTQLRGSPLEGFAFDEFEKWISPQLACCPFPIENAFDLFWWLNFSMKHQHVELRLWTRRRRLTKQAIATSIHHFFVGTDFEVWSMAQTSDHLATKFADSRDWKTYKQILKDYIFEFDGNEKYRAEKVKVGSLRQRECFIGAIDRDFNVLTTNDLTSVLSGKGPLLESFDNPLNNPLIWLSLIMPSPTGHDTRRWFRSLGVPPHAVAARVCDSMELDAGEKDWLLRTAKSKAHSELPSFSTDSELLHPQSLFDSASLQHGNSEARNEAGSYESGSVRSLFAALSRRFSPLIASQSHSGSKVPLNWPWTQSPLDMGCEEAGAGHIAVASAAGFVTVNCMGEKPGQKSLRLHVQSHVQKTLFLEVPLGSIFIPYEVASQPLVVAVDTKISLRPNSSEQVEINTFGGYSSKRSPWHSAMQPSMFLAPRSVCTGQAEVWRWSRKYEHGKKGQDGGQTSTLSSGGQTSTHSESQPPEKSSEESGYSGFFDNWGDGDGG